MKIKYIITQETVWEDGFRVCEPVLAVTSEEEVEKFLQDFSREHKHGESEGKHFEVDIVVYKISDTGELYPVELSQTS